MVVAGRFWGKASRGDRWFTASFLLLLCVYIVSRGAFWCLVFLLCALYMREVYDFFFVSDKFGGDYKTVDERE